MIGGQSPIDVPKLYIYSLSDAEAFLETYGFEWDQYKDRAIIESLRQESITFIKEELLFDEPELKICSSVENETDIRKFLLWASSYKHDNRHLWACTLLRVMHTFAHCDSFFKDTFSDDIQKQIIDRFKAHIYKENDQLFLGRYPESIPLDDFQIKGQKTRRSLAMKLLHKPNNVAADIFDWLGVRFVASERLDALLIARYLRVNNIISFAHIKPGRSRNTLIDIPRLKHDITSIEEKVRSGKIARANSINKLRVIVREHMYPAVPTVGDYNKYSSVAYHAIQFTASQTIRVPNPWLGKRAGDVFTPQKSSGRKMLRGMLGHFGVQTEFRFRFPFEIQILDRESYALSRSGLASHEVYKEKQRKAVKKRLWGTLVKQNEKT